MANFHLQLKKANLMKLATFICPDSYKKRLGIIRSAGIIDVVSAANILNLAVPAKTVKAALCSGTATLAALTEIAENAERMELVLDLDMLQLLPPIPNPSKFFCVGKNNRKHREELVANDMLNEVPNEPTGFVKINSTMCGQDSKIERPEGIATLDYEPELVFVISKFAHGVAKEDAMDFVGGFTLFNDITAREIQKREVASGTRFWTAKNMPNFSPIGPFIATIDEVDDVNNLWITCSVNGEQRLRENTCDYIYTIPDVIEHFSHYMPFEAGDLIAMGAPQGVAMGQPNADELYLQPGDEVEISIENVMTLRNQIVTPSSL